MSIEGVYRYGDLIKSIVKGSFYQSKGTITPYRSGETGFLLETGTPDELFGLYLNEVYSGQVQSDDQGNVKFRRKLPLGDIEVTLIENISGKKHTSWLTIRSYATWLAAYANSLELIDDNIQEVRDNLAIMTATVNGAEEAFGKYVDTYNDLGQSINDYNRMIHELRLAYRNQGARLGGLDQAVSVFTQVPPFGFTRKYWGPNWWLDHNFLSNHRFLNRSHSISWTTTSIDGIELLKVEPDVVEDNSHLLSYESSTNILTWFPVGAVGPSFVEARNGELFLPGVPSQSSQILSGKSEPFDVVSGINDYLYLEMDDKGIINILLNVGLPTPLATDIITIINAAFTADVRYGASYNTVAYDVDGRVMLKSPTIGNSSIRVHNGPSNAGLAIFDGPVKTKKDIYTGVEFVEMTADDLTPDALFEYEYNETAGTYKMRWQSPNSTFGSWVDIEESIRYNIIDGSGKLLSVDVDFDSLPSLPGPFPAVEQVILPVTFVRFVDQIEEEKGIWLNIDVDQLPAGVTSRNVTIEDDSTFGDAESPDYWRLVNPGAGVTTSFEPSEVITSKVNDLDPNPAFRFRITDTAADANVVGRILKFNAPGPDDKKKMYPISDPSGIYDYEGFEVVIIGWVKNYSTSAIDVQLGFNWDGITTNFSPTMAADPGNAAGDYPSQRFIWVTQIPNSLIRNQAHVEVALSSQSGGLDAGLESFSVEVSGISSRNLIRATVPRSRHRQYFGNLLWVWSPDPITLKEKEYIGIQHKSPNVRVPFPGVEFTNFTLDTTAGQGLIELSYVGASTRLRWNSSGNTWTGSNGWVYIVGNGQYILETPGGDHTTVSVLTGSLPSVDTTRYITISDITKSQGNVRKIAPAQSSIDIFDVTEYDSNGIPINLHGVVNEGDFSDGVLQNLETNSGTPFRFAYLSPTRTSVEGELLSFDGTTRLANLSLESDQDQDNTLLFEDNVLLPNDKWQFNSSQEIEIPNPSDYKAGSTYTIDYNLLYRFTSDTILLPSTFADYVWYVDYYNWVRLESEKVERENTVPLYFNPENGRAVLSNRSNMDLSTAILYRDTNNNQIEVAQRYWRFINNKTVEIDASELIGGASYFLSHEEIRIYERNNLNITFEHRQGSDETALQAASWNLVDRNENIDVSNGDRYHQLRMQVQGIRDIRDFRIRSMILKGLHMFGSNPNIPGLTNLRR